MYFVFFCHSLVSDWNNGNAHFLRGTVRELLALGHRVKVYEPADGWSRGNLRANHGTKGETGFRHVFPALESTFYKPEAIDLEHLLDGADVVIVHEWNEPSLVARIGRHRAGGGRFLLFFHDTHHRAQTLPETMKGYELDGYDGVLAFGEVIRQIYLRLGWARQAWTWHEAADTALFHPLPDRPRAGDLVWIGNWGDDERAAELSEYLLEPVRQLGLRARLHGVRYPQQALEAVHAAGIEYAGWLPNYAVPEIFSRFRMTVHVPRRPYVEQLPGIPTIRVFEALACGIPLVCSPWHDAEGLFRPGTDYLVASDGAGMRRHLQSLMNDPEQAASLIRCGLETINSRHTCRHRVEELLAICRDHGRFAPAQNSSSMEVA